jgi:hypothetical protein
MATMPLVGLAAALPSLTKNGRWWQVSVLQGRSSQERALRRQIIQLSNTVSINDKTFVGWTTCPFHEKVLGQGLAQHSSCIHAGRTSTCPAFLPGLVVKYSPVFTDATLWVEPTGFSGIVPCSSWLQAVQVVEHQTQRAFIC